MTRLVLRHEWGAKPPKSPPTPHKGKVAGTCWHWLGLVNVHEERTDPSARWRNIQDYHLNHPTIPWVDIAYNVGVGHNARCYELRGLDVRSGAEGPLVARLQGRRYLSCVAQLGYRLVDGKAGPEMQPTPEMLQAMLDMRAMMHERVPASAKRDRCHGLIRRGGKDCPGPSLTPWILGGMVLDVPVQDEAKPDNPWKAEADEAWEWAEAVGLTDGSRRDDPMNRSEGVVMLRRMERRWQSAIDRKLQNLREG